MCGSARKGLTVTIKPHMVGKWTLDQWKALFFVNIANKLVIPKPRKIWIWIWIHVHVHFYPNIHEDAMTNTHSVRIQHPHSTTHTTHHNHNLLLQDWFKYSVDVYPRNASMSDINKITSSLSANIVQITLQETEVRGKRLLKYEDWCRVRVLIWRINVMR